MSGLLKFVLASDVRALKDRVDPFVLLIDGLVHATPSLGEDLRRGWADFAKQWRAFYDEGDGARTSAQYDMGEELERVLRGWKSVLASHCFGVPAAATKRAVPLLPTLVTPNTVRELKSRVDLRMRALDERVVRAPRMSDAFRWAWRALIASWSRFALSADEWSHAAAQYDCAMAYDDAMVEWEDAFLMAVAPPARPTSSGADASGPWPQANPVPPASDVSPIPSSRGPAMFAIGAGLVFAIVLAKGVSR